MDDYLVFAEDSGSAITRDKVLNIFKEKRRGLSFASEVLREECIQFLDLWIMT